jgi:pimeloyl-ACP methyl ester carboxylesterase
MTPLSWLQHDGVRLAIHGGGKGGRMVVFQHGLCGGAAQVAEVMQGLDGQIWRAVDCPGHGASPLQGPVSIAAFADHVVALIKTLPHPVVLGGISMGAAISTRIAVHHPNLVAGLMLARPAWGTDAAPENMAPNAEVGALLARLPPDQARAQFAASDTARRLARDAPDNLASLMGFFDRAPQAETARLLQVISTDGPGISHADLQALDCPTLVCGTTHDAIHPLGLAQGITHLIPRAQLVTLPPKADDKAAHLAALAAAMTHFLQEI